MFAQNGSDITAYQVSAYSLKPLDVELGLDIEAMAASGNARVLPRAYRNEGYGDRQFFNLTTIGAIAKKAGGHGGMDYMMDLRWAYCMQKGLPLDMDAHMDVSEFDFRNIGKIKGQMNV